MGQAKINLNVGAIKDDYFAAATSGLTEDKLFTSLNVLANAPKAAHVVGLMTTVTDQPDAKGPLFAYSANGAMVSLDADGNVLYSGENFKAMLDSLAQGEVFKDSFAYLAQLGNGVMSPASATLEIAGVNDAPRAYDYKAFIQDGEGNDSFPIWKGIWHATDPDHGAVIHFLPQKIEGGLFNGGISADGAFSLVPMPR